MLNPQKEIVAELFPIPDVYFAKKIKRVLPEAVDANGNLRTDLSKVVHLEELNVSSGGIKTLEGIQFFKKLKKLTCDNNQLELLDLSSNVDLQFLNCSSNQIFKLDLSNSLQFLELNCSKNNLEELDVHLFKHLEVLKADSNNLHRLDVRHNSELLILLCKKNQLTFLDLRNNPFLTRFEYHNNPLRYGDILWSKKQK